MQELKGKILVIRGGAIGDFVLTLPVFAALRTQFPGVHLEVLGYPHIAQLALAGGLVDQMRSIEARALAGFFAQQGTLDPQLGEYFASFALIVSYLYDPDKIFQANVARCSQAQLIVGPHRPDEALNLHATGALLKPLERLAIFDSDPVPKLRIDLENGTWQTSPLAHSPLAIRFSVRSSKGDEASDGQHSALKKDGTLRRIAIHPGSGSEKKNWPESNWAELITRLVSEMDCSISLVGGEAEGNRIERLSRLVPDQRLSVLQNLPLSVLAMRLQQCDFFIGHDSGISHLAAATGLRGLVLWGETNLAVWRPRSENFAVLRTGEGLSRLDLVRVWAEIHTRVGGPLCA